MPTHDEIMKLMFGEQLHHFVLDTFDEVLLGDVVLGSLYALMATGLAPLVWTTLGIFNFAHGTFIALGAYIAWQIASSEASGAGTSCRRTDLDCRHVRDRRHGLLSSNQALRT